MNCRPALPLPTALLAAALLLAVPAHAALDVGDKAPDFNIEASLAGKSYRFSLAEALKKGPVVLYFFPAARSESTRLNSSHHRLSRMPSSA